MHKFLLFFFTTIVSYSQTTYFIPKAGVSIAGIKYLGGEAMSLPDDPTMQVSFSSRAGWTGGMALEIGIGKRNVFALQPEIMFIQKGFGFKTYNDRLRIYEPTSYTLNYLEIPLLLKSTIQLNRFRFSVYTGPSLGRGIGGTYQYFDNKYPLAFKPGAEVRARSRYDLAVIAGGGIGYRIGRITLLGEARFNWGMQQLKVGEDLRFLLGGIDFKNRFWNITAGIAFPLGGEGTGKE
jgi:hypothetical protein